MIAYKDLETGNVHQCSLASSVPEGVAYIETAPQPDRVFRQAFDIVSNELVVDMNKAKEVVHAKRRIKRDELFAPLDIEATIPSKAVQAEASRQVIRDIDAMTQNDIDNASTEAALRSIIESDGL